MKRLLLLLPLLATLAGIAGAQTLTMGSVTGTQSGTIPLTVTCSSCPGLSRVKYIVDGDEEKNVTSAPWSYQFNTNWRHNGLNHFAYAVAYNAKGILIATSPSQTFSIANFPSYGESASYIAASSVTLSTAASATWTGYQSITVVMGGTNASNSVIGTVVIDGDYKHFVELTATTDTTKIYSLLMPSFLDGSHVVCLELRDSVNATFTEGWPFEEDCWQVTTLNQRTINLYNSATSADNTGTTFSTWTAGPIPLTAGSFALACLKINATISSVTDTAGNSYTGLASVSHAGGTAQCYYAANVTGNSSNTTTFHISSAAAFPTAIVREYYGVATTSPIDVNTTAFGTTGGESITSGTFSTSTANEVVAAFGLFYVQGQNYKAGPGYSLEILGSAGTSFAQSQQTLSTLTNATVSAYFTSNTGSGWVMNIVSLKPAGSLATAPAQAGVGPKEWVVSPSGGTQQLSIVIENADGTSTATTSDMSPTFTTTASSGVCTISSGGLVTGAGFGLCPFTGTLGSGMSNLWPNYGYVSATNAIYHFGKDGLIHSTFDPGVSLYFADVFQNTGNTAFDDPVKTLDQYGIPYSQAGLNVYETTATGSNLWGSSQTNYQTGLTTFVNNLVSTILAPYGLYFHGVITPMVNGSGNLYTGTQRADSPAPPTYLSTTWMNTGLVLGFSGPDESDDDYAYPQGEGRMGQTNGPTSITCVTASPTTWTVNYSLTPPYNGTLKFIITGATTNSILNNTLGGANYTVSNITSSSFQFVGPSCAGGNVTATDSGIIVQWLWTEWDNSTSFTPYNALMTFSSQIASASPAVPIAGEVKAAAGIVSQQGWMSTLKGYAQYGQFYTNSDNIAYVTPRHALLSNFRDPNSIATGPAFRTLWSNMGTQQMNIYGNSPGLTADYQITGPTVSITSISGPTVTFAGNVCNGQVYGSMSRMVLSGASNGYFNGNIFIDACPTPTTATISLATPSSTPADTSSGMLVFADGSTFSNVAMSATSKLIYCPGGGSCGMINRLAKGGQTFTWSGTGNAYYTTNTFILSPCVAGAIPSGSGATSAICGNTLYFREVPPSSQTTTTASATLVIDNYYHRGVTPEAAETIGGPYAGGTGIMLGAMLGAGGDVLYDGGEDFTITTGTSPNNALLCWPPSCPNFQAPNVPQVGVHPFYDNGDAGAVARFWGSANAHFFLQSMTARGYLTQPKYGCPDIGFNIECTLREGSKGNLLIYLNVQDSSFAHALDISGCAVAGQATIRYIIDRSQILMTTLTAGTMSDTPTFPIGGTIAYLCSNNEAAEYNPTPLSVKLADIPTATDVVVEYAYHPWQFSNPIGSGANAVYDLGGASGTVPVDSQMAPNRYFRLKYLNSSGVPVAVGDVEKH